MPTEEKVTRKLRAILSADVEGYSLLMSADEAFTVKTLKEYRSIMSAQVEQHSGRVVDSPGDNMMAEFESAVDAVECAVVVQRILKEKNESLPHNKRLLFRIGVNIGDVIQDGDRLYGEGVNIAARIEGLADAGGVCISRNAFDHIRNKLKYGYEYLGEHSVKNIKELVRVYRVLSSPEYFGKLIGDVPKPLAKNWIWATIVVAAVVITSVVWLVYQNTTAPEHKPAAISKMAFPLPDKPSIAVLPFDNMSGDSDQEYFSDGMAEDVITDLSKIPGLLVISRYSSFAYKGKAISIQKIAEELGVRYLIEGSVRRADDRVRINVQLIDSTTGHHLWAERYDGTIHDIFDLQDRIALKIVTSLALKLTGSEQENLEQKETNSIEAYEAFLKGSDLADPEYLDSDRFAEAIPWLEKAILLDPNYHRAYGALSETYFYGKHVGLYRKLGLSPRHASLRAYDYLEKALKNPTNIAYRASMWKYVAQWQHEKAVDHSMRAIALNPNDRLSLSAAILALSYAGRPDEAVDMLDRMRRVDPACLF